MENGINTFTVKFGEGKNKVEVTYSLNSPPELIKRHLEILVNQFSQNKEEIDPSSFLNTSETSKIDLIKYIIRAHFSPGDWFQSSEIFELYCDLIDSTIPQNTVTMNLSRLAEKEILLRKGIRKNSVYSLNPDKQDNIPLYEFTKVKGKPVIRKVE